MSENKYRTIMKGTTLFGGVQLFQILINILRGKVVALYLGPEGMGINGLFVSSLTLIITLSGMGISISSVRYLAQIKDPSEQKEKINITRYVFLFTAFIGVLITCLCSKILSNVSFKSNEYIKSYLLLSLYVFFTLMNSGFTSIFQALGKLKTIASVNIFPSMIFLLVTFVFYYFWGKSAIVPVLIISSVLPFIFYVIILCKTVGKIKKIPFKSFKSLFIEYFTLGFILIVGSLTTNAVTYFLNFFISHFGSIDDVGLYHAGTSITNQYIGMLFSAMAIDYFPRLSSLNDQPDEFNKFVNAQSEVINLIGFPLISLMIITAPLLIKILLSPEFLVIKNFITIIAFGMMLKVFSYPYGYVSIAKNSKKIYFILEVVVVNIQNIILYTVSYYYFGLKGLAIGFVISYVLYFFEVTTISKLKFNITINVYNKLFYLISFIIVLTLCIFSFSTSKYLLIISIVLTILVCLFSIWELNKKMELKQLILNKIKKR